MSKAKFALLPESISVSYRGEIRPENVIDIFSHYDVFLFPSKGENFGHVIYEALAAGCIPIISDTTPWTTLDREKCGAVVKLDDLSRFQKEMHMLCRLSNKELLEMKKMRLDMH